MDIIKKWAKRSMMTMLLLAALLTTFQAISGVEANTFAKYLYQIHGQDQEVNTYSEYKNKVVGLVVNFLDRISSTEKLISASGQVSLSTQKLEELDWSKYPTKTIIATGYTAGIESTGKNPGHPEYGITYSGVKVKRDLFSTIAADLTVFPIGTILFIPEYGYGVVADKGGAIKGDKLDLYYDTVEEVYEQWGKKTLEVSIIKMGDGKLTESELTAMNEDETLQVFRQQYTGDKKS